MTLLSVAEFQALSPSPLGDAALQLLLDAVEQEIVRYAGDGLTTSELFDGGNRFLSLARPAAAITSITESFRSDSRVLAADDYVLHPGGYLLERLITGTNGRFVWWGRIAVVYQPVDELELRQIVQRDLINLALAYEPGLASETIGAWSEAFTAAVGSNKEEREAILSRLSTGSGMVVVGSPW